MDDDDDDDDEMMMMMMMMILVFEHVSSYIAVCFAFIFALIFNLISLFLWSFRTDYGCIDHWCLPLWNILKACRKCVLYYLLSRASPTEESELALDGEPGDRMWTQVNRNNTVFKIKGNAHYFRSSFKKKHDAFVYPFFYKQRLDSGITVRMYIYFLF